MPTDIYPPILNDKPPFAPCWHCYHFGRWQIGHFSVVRPGERVSYAIAVCHHRGIYNQGQPEWGCAYWEREPGSDDELTCIDPAGRLIEPLPRKRTVQFYQSPEK